MTVAQLVHPARGRARQLPRSLLHTLRRAAFHRWSCDAALWRAILTGLGFAAIGLLTMVLAIGAAGVAPLALHANGAAPVAGAAMADRRLEVYRNPAEALTAAMPVP